MSLQHRVMARAWVRANPVRRVVSGQRLDGGVQQAFAIDHVQRFSRVLAGVADAVRAARTL